MTHAQVTNCQ